jgi:PAS domain S-box-containing protein
MTRRSAFLLALLIAGGFLGNYFACPLFFGADFLFGSIAVLLVLYFYGLTWGMLAGLVAYSYTWILWGHPYGFVNLMTEALFVGLVLKRGYRNLLLIDGIFWLLLGAPLIWLYLGVILHMDATTATFIILKQSINGIFNATVVSLAVYHLPLERLLQRPRLSPAYSLRDSLISLLVMLALLPTLLLTIREARQEKQSLEAQVIGDLQALTANVQFHLNFWFEHHKQTVQKLAKLATAASMTPTERLQYAANIIKLSHKDLLALNVINAAGRTIVFAPEVNAEGESNIGWDFSDRPWFKAFKAKQAPMVGDIFLGKTAFADTPLVMVSAPVFVDKRWAGLACVTLNLTRLQETIKPYSRILERAAITLTDSKGQVVVSTRPGLKVMQVWDWKKTGASHPLSASMYHWYPDPKLPSVTRWKQSFYVEELPLGPDFSWKLTVGVPLAPLQQTLYAIYVQNLTIMAILTALALLFSLLLSRWLTRPLEQLSQVTASLPAKLSEVRNLEWPMSSSLEINSLIANSKSMAHTIEENFHDLQVQGDKLQQVNRELRKQIQERQRAEEHLKSALSLQHATLESTADGLLTVDCQGRIVSANQKFREMCHIPNDVVCDEQALKYALDQLVDPEAFLEKVKALYAQPAADSFDVVDLKDGRIFERYSTPQYLDKEIVGRVWSFRDVTERKLNEAEIILQQQELRGLSNRLAQIEENERQHLAQELHDQVCQNLASINICLETIRIRAQWEPLEQLLSRIADIGAIAERTNEITRNIMEGLRPTVLDHYGLMGGLRQFGKQFSQQTGIDLQIHGEDNDSRLTPQVELALFRIALEALNNTQKYARASHIALTRELDQDTVRLVIADNGVGFDKDLLAQPRAGHGWGLKIMNERAMAVGATCRIETQPGQGTRVVIEIPR